MATITTKFSVGDKVWHATTTTVVRQSPCPDCLGAKKWNVTSPGGQNYSFACPRCTASYSSLKDASLNYTEFTPCVRLMTIGSIRADTAMRDCSSQQTSLGVKYMCEETGVGSGSIYREETLFNSEQEALLAAAIAAAKHNAETPHVVEGMKRAFNICDYQLFAAQEKIWEYRARAAESRLHYIREDLEGCVDMDDVRSQIERLAEKEDE